MDDGARGRTDDGDREKDKRLIEETARLIQRLGLTAPAVLYGEAFKPLSWLGSQMTYLLGPAVAGPLIGLDRVNAYGRLLEDRGNVERLLTRLEELAAEDEARPSARGGKGPPIEP